MAAFASHHVRLALFPLRLDRDRTGYVDIPHSLGRRKVLLIADVNTIRETNNAIFDDIFWVHLAYATADDGIDCLRGLLQAEPPLRTASSPASRRSTGPPCAGGPRGVGGGPADGRGAHLGRQRPAARARAARAGATQPRQPLLRVREALLDRLGADLRGARRARRGVVLHLVLPLLAHPRDPAGPPGADVAEDHPLRRPLALDRDEHRPALPALRRRHRTCSTPACAASSTKRATTRRTPASSRDGRRMLSFTNLLVVMAIAFAAPFLLGLLPRVQLPSVVLEIVAGIVVGPSVLGLVEVDAAVQVVALLGLAFVLFLAGLEIEFEKLRGPVLRIALLGFALSFAIAVVVSLGLEAGGLIDTPLLVAIILCATSLGVLVPVLKDSGEIASTFGQLIIAAASIADFGAIILLTIFFSGEGGTGSTLLLLGALFALAATVLAVVRGAERSTRIRADLLRLQDTTAQIRVRAALVLLVGFAALAETLGLEAILGAFIAGTIISLADRDERMTTPTSAPSSKRSASASSSPPSSSPAACASTSTRSPPPPPAC